MLIPEHLKNPRIVLPAAGILVAIPMSWYWLSASRPASAAPKPAGAAIAVDTAAVGRADVPVYLDGLGTVQAFYTATITARVDGELIKVPFVEGQEVKQGDLLAQIDPRPYHAALDQAIATHAKDVAQLASARSDLERYELLAPRDLASKSQVDNQRALVAQLQAQIKGDEASIDNARTQVSYTSIRSPINGRTGIRRLDPGNIVHASDSSANYIVVVTQVQPIACIFTLPEEVLPAINAALSAGPVAVSAVSRDGKTELDQGEVSLIDNQIDQTTGTIRVKATFPNLHRSLWPGQFVNARVHVQTVQGALTIPTAAIQRGPDGEFAYVVKADSTVEARLLKVGAESGKVTIITDGVREGERVVTTNQYRLQQGSRVRSAGAAVAATGAPPPGDGT
jgi:multidrug efflux system membrane fusion protein